MDIITLIIAGFLGVILGSYFAKERNKKVVERIVVEEREENKIKLVEFLRENGEIRNNDVEGLLDVSDSTATRYLNELEEDGLIKQVGESGRGVYYVLVISK